MKSCSSGTLTDGKCRSTSYTTPLNYICATSACGVNLYKECWHYGSSGSSSGGAGSGGNNTLMTR